MLYLQYAKYTRTSGLRRYTTTRDYMYYGDNGNNDRETNRKIKRKELRISRIVDLKNKSDLMYTCKNRRVGLFVKEGFVNEKENTLREKIIKVIKPTEHRVHKE